MSTELLWFDENDQLQDIAFDACTKQTHNRVATVTEHAVESGAVISDHVVIQPVTLSLTVLITDRPVISAKEYLFPSIAAEYKKADRPTLYYELLKDIQLSATPVAVITNLDFYENMVISSLKQDVDYHNGGSMLVELGLKEVISVDVIESTLKVKAPNKKTVEAKTAKGAAKVTEQTPSQAKSVLAGISDFF